ncbi:MAG: YhbY family RNA-binding protein [Rhodanobacteraceae bacterium]
MIPCTPIGYGALATRIALLFMPLSTNQKRYLRGLAHARSAIIAIGQKGLTDAVRNEFDHALKHHELVKVKIAAHDRDHRSALIVQLAESAQADIVHAIGHTACYYRRNPEHTILTLPA